ncbi:hypothetical protein [Actinoplanes sp. NBRC 101535]|uniref:hypothetical protein n=1 Tax=Actinoplanes sp. NBRC 101535 TaxID=3032196 RepID=UPI0024A06B96|nr:hypothetical protein [Actinoplanes sp. NBRC 101535]GLY01452.1 hypothetical protein Acsp01_18310 [Actinoplanes sp. NBRC 101535]
MSDRGQQTPSHADPAAAPDTERPAFNPFDAIGATRTTDPVAPVADRPDPDGLDDPEAHPDGHEQQRPGWRQGETPAPDGDEHDGVELWQDNPSTGPDDGLRDLSVTSDDAPGDAPAQGEPGEIDVGPFLLAGESDQPAETPARPSNVRTIVLAVLLVVVLAGGGMLAYVGWQINSERHTTLSTPPQIADLVLDDSEDATATADYLRGALSAEVQLDKTVGGVYSTPEDKNVLFFGGTTLLWSPEKELDNAFSLIADDEGAVTSLKSVDPGDLGGVMKCGTTKSDGVDMAVCGWSDHGSLALAMFPQYAEADVPPLMRQIRTATQTRS